MKKSLLFGLGGFMIVSSVFALPAPEDRKALCEKYPDKYVWVEKTEACVPVNPCLSDNAKIKQSYCDDETFADVRLTYINACSVMEMNDVFMDCLFGSNSFNKGSINVSYPWASKPNYLAKKDNRAGTYKVYKFADAYMDEKSSAFEYLTAICKAIGGVNIGETYYNDKGFASIDCKSGCQGVYPVFKDALDFMFDCDIDKITISFKSESACYSYDNCYSK